MKKIILLGAGGHATSCVDVIESTKKFKILGFLSDTHKMNQRFLGYKILGDCKNLQKIKLKTINLHIAFGSIYNQKKRHQMFLKLKKLGFLFPKIISPFSYVSKNSKIDEGSIVLHHATINSQVSIGKNCIINTKANIEHDTTVKDNCHISTGAILNGNVFVDSNSFIGSGSVVKEGKRVKKNSFIKMGHIFK